MTTEGLGPSVLSLCGRYMSRWADKLSSATVFPACNEDGKRKKNCARRPERVLGLAKLAFHQNSPLLERIGPWGRGSEVSLDFGGINIAGPCCFMTFLGTPFHKPAFFSSFSHYMAENCNLRRNCNLRKAMQSVVVQRAISISAKHPRHHVSRMYVP